MNYGHPAAFLDQYDYFMILEGGKGESGEGGSRDEQTTDTAT